MKLRTLARITLVMALLCVATAILNFVWFFYQGNVFNLASGLIVLACGVYAGVSWQNAQNTLRRIGE